MEGQQRQQYIPARPQPTATQSGPQGHPMPIPPPPPRIPHTASRSHVPPPPPGPPPTSSYPLQSGGWQQNWTRPAMGQAFPPPPPPMMPLSQGQNHHPAYSAQNSQKPAPLSIPHHPSSNEPPLTYATYVPGPGVGSWGPGVGIPPLATHEFHDSFARVDKYAHSQDTDHLRYTQQPYNDGTPQYTQFHRPQQFSISVHESPGTVAPGNQPATTNNPHSQVSIPSSEPQMPANMYNNGGTSSNGIPSNDADVRWPLDRVLLWLAHNGFSNDWQETFKLLELKGVGFIELGSRGNLGKMHTVVYPQLAKECVKSGTGWDHTREREEGKRMRKLIRRISNNMDTDTAATNGRYYETSVLPSASTDGGVENSPNIARDPMSGLFNNMTAENSFGYQFPKADTSTSSQRQYSGHYITVGNTNTQDTVSNESALPDFLKSDISRRKHSPSASSDTGLPPPLNRSDNRSHGSPATQFASMSPAGDNHSKFEHNKRNSSDSTMSRGLSSQPMFGGQGSSMRTSMGVQFGDRRPGQNSSPQEQVGKHGWGDTNQKEQSKSLFNRLRKKIGHDSTHHSSEEMYLESPTSPVNRHTPPVTSKQGLNSREPQTGERPASSMSDYERFQAQSKNVLQTPPSKKFVFATPDGWNYRLIDVTDVDAADALRAHLCHSVGIKDPGSALIYLTEPGQIMHEEPLSDTMLVVNRRSKSDASGTLKFFVENISMAPPAASAGLGLSFGERVVNEQRLPVDTTDEESYYRTTQVSQARRVSPPRGHGQPTSNATPSTSFPLDQSRHAANPMEHTGPTTAPLSDKEAALLAAQEQHQRETEQKQRAYLQSKQEQIQRKEDQSLGIKGKRVIDFDSPRISPFEEKRTESLTPFRKPPLAPSESSTLTKVNSLSKPPGERSRGPGDIQKQHQKKQSVDCSKNTTPGVHSLGAALVGVGKISGVIGTPFTSNQTPKSPSEKAAGRTNSAESSIASPQLNSPVSRKPSFSRRKGNTQFKVPDYDDEQEGNIKRDTKDKPNELVPRNIVSRSVSPASERPPEAFALQPRKSFGPDFDFQESEVSFVKSPLPNDASDEDSDENLFAKPLFNNKPSPQAKRKPAPIPVNNDELRPSLKVETETRAIKGRSVTFKSPTICGEASAGVFPSSAALEPGESRHQSFDTEVGTPSVEENRRESFVRDDIWASRPPVEGMIDHLDDFFPDIDLDEPYLEGAASSPPSSPSGKLPRDEGDGESAGPRDRTAQPIHPIKPQIPKDIPDTIGSDESTVKAKRMNNNVAQRSLARSGGLGRMKSIREVAKGAHQVSRNQSVASNNTKSGMLRRKSTKMFGARIMQISPKPGTRLSDLEPMPQQAVPHGKLPQRQPTFRIIRGQLIGKGTYGKVFLGINADTGEILAVKQVEVNQKAANYDKDRVKEMVSATDQEIDTMQHLEHPNIVQYLGCERGDLSISIYLEYIPGGSVGSCLRKHGKFEESVVQSLNRQVLSGLAYLHDQGILHRDLKADNILLDLDGTCKISDFGISKKSDNIYGNDVTNSMQGSVFWMAPEVVQSQGQGYSAKVDIWSLGCVVLEMFAGRRPWSREEAIGAIFKLGSLTQAPPIPEDVSLEISPAAIAFMYDCFTIDTFDRPTATTLLSKHPFCASDPHFNFLDTELHAKIRHVL